MSGLMPVYVLIGLLLGAAAWLAWRSGRRIDEIAFWGVLALLFCTGDLLPVEAVGALVIVLALLAGFGRVGRHERASSVDAEPTTPRIDIGDRVFIPALAIPVLTLVGVFMLKTFTVDGKPLMDSQQVTLISLATACLLSVALAMVLTRAKPAAALHAGYGLLDAIGWAAVLPLMLAMLGAVFAQAHVGDAIADLVSRAIPVESRLACVVAYGLGMVLFTAIMGNAFAAFPVLTAGIALPLLIGRHGAHPAPLAAIGMLTGYCGTLLTPMAANFNLVPVALLELEDDWAVIKAQAPTGLILLAVNLTLMYWLAFL